MQSLASAGSCGGDMPMKNNIYGFMVDFTVPIRPVGKGRPRFTRNGHPYAPVDTKNAIRINVMEVQ